ncbi:TonB-dependent receptor [Epilithonimonas sp. UC225_85]|uniref:TonB-dependent receptor n=1 Tax=Epilithonimonas sp. UC225_85 TaxID=3350167 RepID=UPI0036D39C38
MKKIKIPLLLAFATGTQIMYAQKKDSVEGSTHELEGVVITASKIRESLLKSSASVKVLSEKDIRNTPSNSFYDALENVQGLQMITPSLGFKVINARGFTNTTNVRFAQLVNGMDIASPHIGSAIANSLGPNDLDIEKVEVLPGMASALYGMNTMNGLANLITKNPFTSQGLSIRQNTALTHLSNENSKAQLFTETSFRYAKAISTKFAFKINGSILQGSDWIASDYSDLNPDANKSLNLLGADNPAYDAVNSYGNESSNRKIITLGGKKYVVARTGYLEKDLADNILKNIKADAGLYYKFNQKSMISYTYRFSSLDNIYQRANRFKLQDYFTQQHGLQFENPSITARIYLNNESTGKSYNLRSMGENIDRNFKTDANWYSDFTKGYNTAIGSGTSVIDALKQARQFADNGRYQPGTEAYNAVLKQLQDVNNWDIGAALRVKQSFLHSEVQVNLTEQYLSKLKDYGINILIGADNRTYFIMPDGNYFINPKSSDAFENYTYSKTGGFVSVTKKLFQEKLSLQGILRVDKSDYFKAKLNPRFSAVYTPISRQSFRTSFQQGYRFPSIFEAFSNVNSGGVKRVGGLSVMSNGIFENAYLDTSIKAFQAQVLSDINGGMAQSAAIEKNKGLLKKNPYTYLTPEKVKTLEFGYKGLFLDKSLFIDANVYFSHYQGFIAQTNMNVPNTSNEAEIPVALYDNTKQTKYRMYTNSKTAVNAYGYSLGATYIFAKGYTAKANATFSKLKNIENQDGLEDGFNTPDWMVNFSITKENILKNTDVGLVYRWQNSFYWQSFLANGQVGAYTNIDTQIAHRLPKINASVKIGATNLLNHYYTSFIGAPSVGGIYYTTIIYNL